MRTAAMCLLCGVIGCTKPTPVESVQVALAPEPTVAPMPRDLTVESDPIMFGLRRGTIKPGDSITEVAKLDSSYDLTQNGAFTILGNSNLDSPTHLVAKDGKLVLAIWRSCCHGREYFNEMTKEDEDACWNGYREARLKQRGLIAPPPREAGKPNP